MSFYRHCDPFDTKHDRRGIRSHKAALLAFVLAILPCAIALGQDAENIVLPPPVIVTVDSIAPIDLAATMPPSAPTPVTNGPPEALNFAPPPTPGPPPPEEASSTVPAPLDAGIVEKPISEADLWPTEAALASRASAQTQLDDLYTFKQMIVYGLVCAEMLDPVSGDASTIDSTQDAVKRIQTLIERLAAIDEKLASGDSHWTWFPLQMVPLQNEQGFAKRFIIDPPLGDTSAVKFRCTKRSAEISTVKTVDANEAITQFRIARVCSRKEKTFEILYLHYPADLASVTVNFPKKPPSDLKLQVLAGKTDLPEYGRQARYWLRLALQEIELGNTKQAAEHIKRSIVKIYHYKRSRNRQ